MFGRVNDKVMEATNYKIIRFRSLLIESPLRPQN